MVLVTNGRYTCLSVKRYPCWSSVLSLNRCQAFEPVPGFPEKFWLWADSGAENSKATLNQLAWGAVKKIGPGVRSSRSNLGLATFHLICTMGLIMLALPVYKAVKNQFSSVTQLCPTLRAHGLQHAKLSCASPTPRACSNSCQSHRWCHPTISSSVVPFSSRLQSFPASGSF